jgi:MOSC domain-containing protein YiiM
VNLDRPLFPGAFGEKFTTEGFIEDQVHIGVEFRISTAKLVVTQARMP